MSKRYLPYFSMVRHFILNVHAVEGTFQGEEMTMLVADDGSTLDYMARLAFPEGASISRKSRISALNAHDLVKSSADLVVVGVNRLLIDRYIRRGFRILPKWVKLLLPAEEDPYTRLYDFGRQTRKYFKWMLKKVEEAGFECEICRDDSWCSRFYHEMYRPYTLQRFQDHAALYDPRVLDSYLDRGYLVLARKNGEPVAGVIVYQEGDVMHLPFGGVAGGDVELVREGAMFAIDYFLAQKAHTCGCRSMDFGICRPFMSDGTLKYKLNWHMDVSPFDGTAGMFAMATPGCTPQAIRFLDEHPHFYMSGNECIRSDKHLVEH